MTMPKLNIEKLVAIFGIIVPLWGGMAFLWNYEKSLVKTQDLAVLDLDARIERTEILVAVYAKHTSQLSENETNSYNRAKARLIQLESQRDQLLELED